MFAINKFGVKHAVKVLDDFLIVELKKPVCNGNLDIFLWLCEKAGIPMAPHKTVGPDICIEFLGVELDTILMIARLPRDKLVRYSFHVTELISQRKVTLKELQGIIGQLQYAKAFLRHLIDLTIGRTKPHYYIPLRKEAILDIRMWSICLDKYNGKSFMYGLSKMSSNKVNLYSDASKQGFGATYGSHWIQGSWPQEWKGYHIIILETYPLLALVHTFGHKLRNSFITFYCDNQGVVEIINKQSSKDILE